ncbi:hypothetical protein M3649_03615 [Ureibacillus chungkukjangi]|uniref:hypothetical protein n=1 Tax=Ureibacillus chungkukjangi TaxID=1202712 RepID=UPI00203BA9EA|nr:hypothetical protein [Ureibacillus chungkukjangi]MCM3387218.1 hypothetical protein [Ureibacillus chungkukjangi]
MIAYTDTSVKGNITTISYVLMSWKGRTIKKESFKGLEDKSFQSEIDSIIKLLTYCSKKNYKGVRIFTDCKNIQLMLDGEIKGSVDISYLKHLLRLTESKVKYKNRKHNKAHKLCYNHMKAIENRMNNT